MAMSTTFVSTTVVPAGKQQGRLTARSVAACVPVHPKAGKCVKSARCPMQVSIDQAGETTSLSRRTVSTATAGAVLSLIPLPSEKPASAAAAPEEYVYLTSASGLQYCDVREGDGDAPTKGESIRAHYTGRLASNGRKFDSSYDRGSPLSFKVGVGMVIKGWDEGILGGEGIPPMKAGGLRKLKIPSQLGYGARGAGSVIPPNSDLLFDVELMRPSKFGR